MEYMAVFDYIAREKKRMGYKGLCTGNAACLIDFARVVFALRF